MSFHGYLWGFSVAVHLLPLIGVVFLLVTLENITDLEKDFHMLGLAAVMAIVASMSISLLNWYGVWFGIGFERMVWNFVPIFHVTAGVMFVVSCWRIDKHFHDLIEHAEETSKRKRVLFGLLR